MSWMLDGSWALRLRHDLINSAPSGMATKRTAPTMNHQIDLVITPSAMPPANARGRAIAVTRRSEPVAYDQSRRPIRTIHVAPYAAKAMNPIV